LEKPSTIDAAERTGEWDERLHERFDWLAGDVAARLGYSSDRAQPSKARETLIDARYSLTAQARRLRQSVRRLRATRMQPRS
jgi:hypothetical protein